MKRSKVFLSATTCLLAIAAFAASRGLRTTHSACTVNKTNEGPQQCSTINSSHLSNPKVTCTAGTGKKLVTCNKFVKTLFTSSIS